MQHDETAGLQRLVQHLLRTAAGHGPAVEGVTQHDPGDLRQAGDAGLVHHLVHRHGIADKRRDLQGLGQLKRQHTAQVRGVGRVLHGIHIVHHGLIHQVCAGLAGGQLTAPGADAIQRRHVDTAIRQCLFDGGAAEIHLLHDPVEGRQLFTGIAERLVKELIRPLKQRDLGGGRTGIDDQYPFAHDAHAPGGPNRPLLSVSKNLVKMVRLCYHLLEGDSILLWILKS